MTQDILLAAGWEDKPGWFRLIWTFTLLRRPSLRGLIGKTSRSKIRKTLRCQLSHFFFVESRQARWGSRKFMSTGSFASLSRCAWCGKWRSVRYHIHQSYHNNCISTASGQGIMQHALCKTLEQYMNSRQNCSDSETSGLGRRHTHSKNVPRGLYVETIVFLFLSAWLW